MRRFFEYICWGLMAACAIYFALVIAKGLISERTAEEQMMRELLEEVRAIRKATEREADAREAILHRMIERSIPDVPHPFFEDDPETDY